MPTSCLAVAELLWDGQPFDHMRSIGSIGTAAKTASSQHFDSKTAAMLTESLRITGKLT